MVMVDYGTKKILAFFMVGLFPLLICMVLLALNFPLLGALFFPMLVAFVAGYIGHTSTSQNPFIKAIQGQGILAFDFNSSGIARVFLVNVDVPDINIKTREGNEKRYYDRMISLVLREPENSNLVEDSNKKTMEFTIPTEEYQKSVFKHNHLNFMIFNSQTGMFLTKEFLANMEKTLMVEYVTLNEWRELKEMNKTIRDFTRTIMDTVLHKTAGQILGSPLVKILAIIIAAIVIGYIALQAAPLFGIELIPTNAVTSVMPKAVPIENGNLVVGLMRGWF